MPIHYAPLFSFSFIENCPPQEIVLYPNTYFFEGWGASGGGNLGGSGGYTAGILHLDETATFYVIVGGEGSKAKRTNEPVPGGCNGGGDGGAASQKLNSNEFYMSGSGGGGATDIRFNETTNFSNRILVAGGGGGSCDDSDTRGIGGEAGGPNGFPSTGSFNISQGGGQNQGFNFGKGENGRNGTLYIQGGEGNGGGGGGWYGGYSYQGEGINSNAGGGGGSSYISGHSECTTPHSLFVFTKTILKSGKDSFSSPDGVVEKGHRGNGFFRISLLINLPSKRVIQFDSLSILSPVLFTLDS